MVPDSICVGQILPLIPNTSGEVVALEWDMGSGVIINSLFDTSYVYAQAGTYLIKLYARSACSEVRVEQSIVVTEAPMRSEEVYLCPGDSIYLGGNWATTGGQYIDLIPGTGCDTLLQTTVIETGYHLLERDTSICAGDSILLKGVYQKLEGTYTDTIYGPQCDTIIQTNLLIKPCDCSFEFPNVFTPNADQNNDDFGPYIACDLKVQQYSMFIYNRYGTLVYESDDLTKRWDGKYKGADQPSDVYGWVVQATYLFEDNEVAIIRRGEITLVR
jgi:gliding motility-associated-like protein